MKKLPILIAVLCIFSIGCKKSSTAPQTVTPSSPYYFKFTLDGVSYNLNANFPQYMPFYSHEAGGYEVADLSLYPMAGIRFSWPLGDTVKETDIMGLAGKTIYFNDTNIHPEVSFGKNLNGFTNYSADTSDKRYYVSISAVKFVKKDTTAGYPIRIYQLTGTCNALLDSNGVYHSFSDGSFNFLISRQEW